MKSYIEQFFNEGLATTFYIKPITFVRKYVKNDFMFNLISVVIKILYTGFVLLLAWFMFWDRYPL